MRSPGRAAAIAFGAGFAVWLGLALAGDGLPWSQDAYWRFGYPLLVVLCTGLGAWCRDGAWRLGLVMGLGQWLGAAAGGLGGELLPYAGAIFVLLGAPASLAAVAVPWLLARRDRSPPRPPPPSPPSPG